MTWLKETFSTQKPIIGMCHFAALPGDPAYDAGAGVRAVLDRARSELHALQDGGVDGVMFSNEFSLPYQTKTQPITAITMARIIAELYTDIEVPFGVNVLWDAKASIELAVGTDAMFVREIFTGVYASDFGIWNTDIGSVARHRRYLNGENVRLLFNIVPEGAKYLAERDIEEITRSTVFNTMPDGLCVSGLTAGSKTDTQVLSRVKNAAGNTPVFVNTGVNSTNVLEQLAIADGAIVGTFFKQDGKFENPANAARTSKLMKIVVDYRNSL
ncbi:MAG: BtpA/SgcQ family protein [Anaerolineales bacterium]|nr:BtpA/SgcQ family protein [Anaerolineales bacterium]